MSPTDRDKARRLQLRRRDFAVGLMTAALTPLAAKASANSAEPASFGAGFAKGAQGYEEARLASVWSQLKPDRYPDRIVSAKSVDDVVAVVRHARSKGMKIATKGSGHSYVASFLREGGLLLDMSGLTGVQIEGETALVGPGVKSGVFAAALVEKGRAFPTGHNADVGLGGFLLGGGMGWNGESWGQFACFNVLSVDVVTPEGKRVTASATSHPDLFWAARGGGPAFPGVVTGVRVKTYPHPQGLRSSHYLYPIEAAEEIAAWLSPIGLSAHGNLETFLSLEAEPVEHGKRKRRDLCRVFVLAYDTESASLDKLKQVAAAAPKGATEKHEFAAVSFAELYANSITGPSRRIANDTLWTNDGIGLTARFAPHAAASPSEANSIIINFRGAPKLPADAPMRAGSTFTTFAAQWEGEANDAANLEWIAAAVDAINPLGVGCYVNETDFLRRPERARLCFTDASWAKLSDVIRAYDPKGLFPPAFPV